MNEDCSCDAVHNGRGAYNPNLPEDLRVALILTDIESTIEQIEEIIRQDVTCKQNILDMKEVLGELTAADKLLSGFLKRISNQIYGDD